MSKKKANKISTFGSQLTAMVSVSLVLFVLGVLAVLGLIGHKGSETLRDNLGFVVKMMPDAGEQSLNAVKRQLAAMPEVASYVFSSADDIMEEEIKYFGENMAAVLDVNPYGAEFDVRVVGACSSLDSITAIASCFNKMDCVDEVLTENDVIVAINESLERVGLLLLAVFGALLVVSVVLIYNTVHLAVYSRRFIIHTMRLVGATGSFIRKPFIMAGILNGFVSATVASVVLIGMLAYGAQIDPMLAACFTPINCVGVALLLYAVGIFICASASFFASNRFLKTDYDDMFLK